MTDPIARNGNWNIVVGRFGGVWGWSPVDRFGGGKTGGWKDKSLRGCFVLCYEHNASNPRDNESNARAVFARQTRANFCGIPRRLRFADAKGNPRPRIALFFNRISDKSLSVDDPTCGRRVEAQPSPFSHPPPPHVRC